MAVTAMKTKNAVESLREVVQDLLVPDMKAIKVEVESLRRETKIEFDALRTEMRLRDEKQTQAMQALSERQTQAIQALAHSVTQGNQALSGKIGYTTDLRERLAVLEDRGKRPS